MSENKKVSLLSKISDSRREFMKGLATVAAGVYDGCLAQVEAAVSAECSSVGGVANTVYGGCVEQANGEILDTCNAYVAGAQGQVADACSPYGGPGDAAYDTCYADNVGAAEATAISGVIAGA